MDEMDSLHWNSFWELVRKPEDQKVIGCKWVFKKKEGIGIDEKEPTRYEARLVVNEYLQKDRVDYDEIFSLVVKHASIQLLLSIVAQWDM
ncbi:hypothetical protein L3X38_024173 [Prunus dulcis]|uniref:Reverse transcriptase Ty1/copia-type domain-containing protein n=1 Tax=Prunus dulcis TaxID=3755 RepID=A0AAD4VZ91_PRUDU|nr:hypothetical protein L3X38_024173 [Prunus dulcis]